MSTEITSNAFTSQLVDRAAPSVRQVGKTTSAADSSRPVTETEANTSAQNQSSPQAAGNPAQPPQTGSQERAAEKEADPIAEKVASMSATELKEVLDEINSALYSYNRALRFELHDKTEDLIVRVLNTKTDEVIRQYPSEEVLSRRAKLMQGETNFFSTKVS